MHLVECWIYPIKSCQGIRLQQAEVTEKGLKWDREWMLIDSQGKFITQRNYPQLATINVTLNNNQTITVSTDYSSCTFSPHFKGKEIPVTIWKDQTVAIDQGEEISGWFQHILKIPCHLVRQSPEYSRFIDKNYTENQEKRVSFADGYPCLLTTTASLEDLQDKLKQTYGKVAPKIEMNRFRPNLVIKTNIPFAESAWKGVKIGSIEFKRVKPCSRCIMITTDQETGERNPLNEPLQTLSHYRLVNGKIMFGENMIPCDQGWISIDNQVQIIS